MPVEWMDESDDETERYTASVGPYDLRVEERGSPQSGYDYSVDVGDQVSDDGQAPTVKEAQAYAMGYIRAETARLAQDLGIISRLIPMSERTPPPLMPGRYLVWAPGYVDAPGHECQIAQWDGAVFRDEQRDYEGDIIPATHWQDLPSAPPA